MRKILILNGAGKRNGNTAALIKFFREGAEAAGHEIKEFFLQNMNIHGCLDCQGCARKPSGDPQPCVQKDDMQQVYDAYAESDVVVFATPVYWFTVSGQLKLAVDRLYAIQRNHGFDGAIHIIHMGSLSQHKYNSCEYAKGTLTIMRKQGILMKKMRFRGNNNE